MKINSYLSYFQQSIEEKGLEEYFKSQRHFHIANLIGSSLSFFVATCFQKFNKSIVLLFEDKEEATYFFNDLENILGKEKVLFFPSSYKRPYEIEDVENANVLMRSEVLSKFSSPEKRVGVTYADALFEKVIVKESFDEKSNSLKVHEKVSVDFINSLLFENQFERVDFVAQPGEFSVRGGIIDVFSFSHNEPYRIEFFGDEIASIRTFDIETQLSIEKIEEATLLSNIEDKSLKEKRVNLLAYLPTDTFIICKDEELISHQLDKLFKKATHAFKELETTLNKTSPDALFCTGKELTDEFQKFSVGKLISTPKKDLESITYSTKEQPWFNKDIKLLKKYLIEQSKAGFTHCFCCSSEKQVVRFKDIFSDSIQELNIHFEVFNLYQGFTDLESKNSFFTDHQFFERYYKSKFKRAFSKKQSVSLKELTALEVGDYVTHIDHGIGKFGGLQRIDVGGKTQEAIKLIYGERDVLYISIHSLHKISKYSGKEGKLPKLYNLGSGAWKKLKQKTKVRIKKIAFDLIQLYAQRKMQKGFPFAPDDYLQHELEASFLYEDTPDQLLTTQAVKKDMEKAHPMDRLVCGDVGFGKTEIAIRAAFKAVVNQKQVAVLVPTTLLAFQHYKTFSERLEKFPVEVEYLSRNRTKKERDDVKKRLEEGRIDIIIGTHQLANAAIQFKDLGLLIVDEEQKFGVGVKDKLKTLKTSIDTLTLTATPIPRTLQFSLMAARDLSVINTPPPNRFPIESSVIRFNEETIRDVISYELQRNGQVFFVHNRIENIKEVAGLLQRLVPDAKIAVGHGQMDGKKTEDLMLSFINNEFDVLVSTTIIESGLDVSNANTILINNAHRFGLSDLHQMRGRVGRSNKKAFCYFITPPFESITDAARKRMNAIELFNELGSGIHIAMKDLEIRGAGDLLGGEQSGFINDLGFDAYQKILNETIEELKNNEFKSLYKEENEAPEKEFVKEIKIDSDFELLFPDTYINSIKERIAMYGRLGDLTTEEALETYRKELEDRFGKLPEQAVALLTSIRVKWKALSLGMERLILKNGKMIGYFIADQNSTFYNSSQFIKVLNFVQNNPTLCVLKEKETKEGLRLVLTFNSINSINNALRTLEQFD